MTIGAIGGRNCCPDPRKVERQRQESRERIKEVIDNISDDKLRTVAKVLHGMASADYTINLQG